MTTRACVLSGGGAKGAFQVGALSNIIIIENLFVNKWFGVSTGSLQGVVMAQGDDLLSQIRLVRVLEDTYGNIKSNKDIYDGPSNSISEALALASMQFSNRQSLYEPKGLRKLIYNTVDAKQVIKGDKFACGVVDFERRSYHLIDGYKNPFLLDFVLASSSMPVYFPPVEISGKKYIDGGLRNQTPLRSAINWLKTQPDPNKELVVILTSPLADSPQLSPINKLLNKLTTTLDILTNEIYLNDLDKLLEKNSLANKGDPRYSYIHIKLIYPDEYYHTTLDFDPAIINDMMNDGLHAPIHDLELPIDLDTIPPGGP